MSVAKSGPQLFFERTEVCQPSDRRVLNADTGEIANCDLALALPARLESRRNLSQLGDFALFRDHAAIKRMVQLTQTEALYLAIAHDPINLAKDICMKLLLVFGI